MFYHAFQKFHCCFHFSNWLASPVSVTGPRSQDPCTPVCTHIIWYEYLYHLRIYSLLAKGFTTFRFSAHLLSFKKNYIRSCPKKDTKSPHGFFISFGVFIVLPEFTPKIRQVDLENPPKRPFCRRSKLSMWRPSSRSHRSSTFAPQGPGKESEVPSGNWMHICHMFLWVFLNLVVDSGTKMYGKIISPCNM